MTNTKQLNYDHGGSIAITNWYEEPMCGGEVGKYAPIRDNQRQKKFVQPFRSTVQRTYRLTSSKGQPANRFGLEFSLELNV